MRKTRRLVDDRSRIHRDSRLEIKYVLDAEGGRVVARCLEDHAEMAIAPSGVSRWEVKTTYFDVPGLELVRQTHAQPDHCVKVRIREYLSTTDEPQPERVWLEIKERRVERTMKIRFPVLQEELPLILAAGGVNGAPALDPSSHEARSALAAICRGRELSPVSEVRYWRRAAFHGENERITLDDDMRWQLMGEALSCHGPDGAAGVEEDLYLEVKGGSTPEWLSDTLGERPAAQVSKLLIATAPLAAGGFL